MMYLSQTHNGAGFLSGNGKGAAANFYSEIGNYKAVYFHCASHEPNLYLSEASTVPQNF